MKVIQSDKYNSISFYSTGLLLRQQGEITGTPIEGKSLSISRLDASNPTQVEITLPDNETLVVEMALTEFSSLAFKVAGKTIQAQTAAPIRSSNAIVSWAVNTYNKVKSTVCAECGSK